MVPVSAAPPRQHTLDLPYAPPGKAGTKGAGRAPVPPSNPAYGDAAPAPTASDRTAPPLHASETQRKVLSYLSLTPRHIDAVAQDAGLTATQAGVEITLMELAGMVRRLPGNTYIRAV